MEADQGILKNVVGLFPPSQIGEPVKHLPGQPQQPVTGVLNEESMGVGIPGQSLVDQVLYLGVRARCGRHDAPPYHSPRKRAILRRGEGLSTSTPIAVRWRGKRGPRAIPAADLAPFPSAVAQQAEPFVFVGQPSSEARHLVPLQMTGARLSSSHGPVNR